MCTRMRTNRILIEALASAMIGTRPAPSAVTLKSISTEPKLMPNARTLTPACATTPKR